jgi:hypothetical protein
LAQKKAKIGRPKLPKGEAKGKIVPVRFALDDLKTMTQAAKAHKQTLSEWVRIALRLEAKERYKGYLIELSTRKSQQGGFETFGWVTKQKNGAKSIPVVSPGGQPTADAALEYGIAWCKVKIDFRPIESTTNANLEP